MLHPYRRSFPPQLIKLACVVLFSWAFVLLQYFEDDSPDVDVRCAVCLEQCSENEVRCFMCRGKIVLGYTEAELRVRGSGYQFIHAADMLYCAENHVRSKFCWCTPKSGWSALLLLSLPCFLPSLHRHYITTV